MSRSARPAVGYTCSTASAPAPGVADALAARVERVLQIAALCAGSQPELIAEQIGNGGVSGLKRVVTESVNEHLRPLRHRRNELAADPAYLLDVLRAGNARANEIAEHTLDEVRAVMGMPY